MPTCQLCRGPIPMAGQGPRRPPRHCDGCKRAILATASQIPIWGFLACVVCSAPLDGRLANALTCSGACKRYLSRLRGDPRLRPR